MTTQRFDCVRMKEEIQRRIIEEVADLSPQERREKLVRDILSDPVLGSLWREAPRVDQRAPSVEP